MLVVENTAERITQGTIAGIVQERRVVYLLSSTPSGGKILSDYTRYLVKVPVGKSAKLGPFTIGVQVEATYQWGPWSKTKQAYRYKNEKFTGYR